MHIFVIILLVWLMQVPLVLLCYGVHRIRESTINVATEVLPKHGIQIVSRVKA